MIKNVIIHLLNEQPLMADLFAMPAATDVALVCTNLRSMNQTRPVFVDDSATYFIFPFLHVRFIEIPPRSQVEAAPRPSSPASDVPELPPGDIAPKQPEPEPDLEIDEDFLRRVRDI